MSSKSLREQHLGTVSIFPAASLEVKSRATERCLTPSGPEGSSGRRAGLCDTDKLDLFLFLPVILHAIALMAGFLASRARWSPRGADSCVLSIHPHVRQATNSFGLVMSGRSGELFDRMFSRPWSLASAGSPPYRPGKRNKSSSPGHRPGGHTSHGISGPQRTTPTYAQRDHYQFHR